MQGSLLVLSLLCTGSARSSNFSLWKVALAPAERQTGLPDTRNRQGMLACLLSALRGAGPARSAAIVLPTPRQAILRISRRPAPIRPPARQLRRSEQSIHDHVLMQDVPSVHTLQPGMQHLHQHLLTFMNSTSSWLYCAA